MQHPAWSSTRWFVAVSPLVAVLVACSGEDDGAGGNGSGVGTGSKGGSAGSGALGVGGRAGAPGGAAGSSGSGGSAGVAGTAGTAGAAGVAGTAGSAGTAGVAGTAGSAGAGSPATVCGDGKIEGLETCDDANAIAGDGCSGECKTERGFFCGKVPGKPCVRDVYCGDGFLDPGEACDDATSIGGDGCSTGCRIERGFTCAKPGAPCTPVPVPSAVCGDGVRQIGERCDDGNVVPGDGCDAACQPELGFRCPRPGAACIPVCGDGLRRGAEDCDDANTILGDGCSPGCQLEPGATCGDGPGTCKLSVCGNNVVEVGESCDDGNRLAFDGCGPTCRLEPTCGALPMLEADPICKSVMGDGIVEKGESCDDGNTTSGDGCDAAGEVEGTPGFSCGQPAQALSTYRVLRDFNQKGTAKGHPDFFLGNAGFAPAGGLVKEQLDANGRPTIKVENDASYSTNAAFAQWFRDDANVNVRFDDRFTFGAGTLDGLTSYTVSAPTDFPLDGRGFNQVDGAHNFYWTSETRLWLRVPADGQAKLRFVGDGDVFVYFAGQKILDMGGVHGEQTGTAKLGLIEGKGTLDWSWTAEPNSVTGVGLGLVLPGETYELRVFHANRQQIASSYTLAIAGFEVPATGCVSTCGDGIVAPDEPCDPGTPALPNTLCRPDCQGFAPYCGDGEIGAGELCDDGAQNGTPGKCEVDCGATRGFCGDGVVDPSLGEECDDGTQPANAYGGCLSTCKLGPRCGDGLVNGTEQCDDGNRFLGDGCTPGCRDESQ